jgi:hypothetical protein
MRLLRVLTLTVAALVVSAPCVTDAGSPLGMGQGHAFRGPSNSISTFPTSPRTHHRFDRSPFGGAAAHPVGSLRRGHASGSCRGAGHRPERSAARPASGRSKVRFPSRAQRTRARWLAYGHRPAWVEDRSPVVPAGPLVDGPRAKAPDL